MGIPGPPPPPADHPAGTPTPGPPLPPSAPPAAAPSDPSPAPAALPVPPQPESQPTEIGPVQGEPRAVRRPPGPTIDLRAVLHRVTAIDTLIGGGLLLLFVFSFIGGWIQITFTCPIADLYCTGSTSSSAGSLWQGFGVLPALIGVAAIGWFVVVKVPELGLGGMVPDSPIWRSPWMGFAGIEVVLFLLYWPLQSGVYATQGSTAPGWALWASVAFAAVVGIGGYLEHRKTVEAAAAAESVIGMAPAGLARSAAGMDPRAAYAVPAPLGQYPAPPPAPPVLPVGTLSADRSEWFDGAVWQDAFVSAPPGALRSPDGSQWWDGVGWRALPAWHIRRQGTEMVRPVRPFSLPLPPEEPSAAPSRPEEPPAAPPLPEGSPAERPPG